MPSQRRTKLSGAEWRQKREAERLKRMEEFAARQADREEKRKGHAEACIRYMRGVTAPRTAESLAHWEAVWRKLIERGVVWSDEEWREQIARTRSERRDASTLGAPRAARVPAQPTSKKAHA